MDSGALVEENALAYLRLSGDKVELVVGYGDFTTVLHDEFYGFRNDRLEVVWPILARGKLQ